MTLRIILITNLQIFFSSVLVDGADIKRRVAFKRQDHLCVHCYNNHERNYLQDECKQDSKGLCDCNFVKSDGF